MITVHFINNSGEDVYVSLSDETSAQVLCEQLRSLEVPAEIVSNKFEVPRVEVPKIRRDLLARIVASYISGIHHEDVNPDEIDKEFAERILNQIDDWVDDRIESKSDELLKGIRHHSEKRG